MIAASSLSLRAATLLNSSMLENCFPPFRKSRILLMAAGGTARLLREFSGRVDMFERNALVLSGVELGLCAAESLANTAPAMSVTMQANAIR
jgi:hypothetical protein